MTAKDDRAMQALSDAGAVCGNCGDQPGDRTCADCERCYQQYVAALHAAGWASRIQVLRGAAKKVRFRQDCLRRLYADSDITGEGPEAVLQAWGNAATELDAMANQLEAETGVAL